MAISKKLEIIYHNGQPDVYEMSILTCLRVSR